MFEKKNRFYKFKKALDLLSTIANPDNITGEWVKKYTINKFSYSIQ